MSNPILRLRPVLALPFLVAVLVLFVLLNSNSLFTLGILNLAAGQLPQAHSALTLVCLGIVIFACGRGNRFSLQVYLTILLVAIAMKPGLADHLPPVHPLVRGGNHAHENHYGHEHSNESLADIDLSFADLRAIFTSANLSSANLHSANLSGAWLIDARLGEADLSDANLNGADLSGADLRFADLRNSNVAEAITDAQLHAAEDVTGVNLGGNDLSGFDLSGLDLSSANLTNTNLTNANLDSTNLDKAIVATHTVRFVDLSSTSLRDTTLGDGSRFDGFIYDGDLNLLRGTTTLNSLGFATLGTITSLVDVTLAAPNGIALGPGENVIGFGNVSAKLAAGFGSTIVASRGNLALGDANALDGFFSDGVLDTKDNEVTVNDANEVVLGSLTKLGDGANGGKLIAGTANIADTMPHFFVEEGKNVTGRGNVDGNFKNNGHVVGDGTVLSERIVFNSPWIVSGKGTFENTFVFGTFSPGESPGITDGLNQAFGGEVRIELGGVTPGEGDQNHDQINDRGTILLTDDSELHILPYNGFVPSVGDHFEVITWKQGQEGKFGKVVTDSWFVMQRIGFSTLIDNAGGAGSLTLQAVLLETGDFNGDLTIDVLDIDELSRALRSGNAGTQFDVNSDGLVDHRDLTVWVEDLAHSYFGDANLDGEFNSSDLVAVFEASRYEDGIPMNSGWSEGDWNGDGDFTTTDLVMAFQDGGFEQGPRLASNSVPEPASFAMLFAGLMGIVIRIRTAVRKVLPPSHRFYRK